MLKPLSRVNIQPQNDAVGLARVLMLLQSAIGQALDSILRIPYLDDVYLKDVALASLTTTKVPHKLGRTPTEWRITDIDGASTIYATAIDDKFLTLYSSGAVTVDLRVS